MKPVVTIGMPVFNCAQSLPVTIQSLINQTFEDWELIIVDDGSRDDTLHAARQFSDPRIRIIEGGNNRGLAARLNQTVELARGEFFARQDGDDLSFPDRLDKQVSFMRSHADVDLVGTRLMVFREDGEAVNVAHDSRPLDPTEWNVKSHETICRRPWTGMTELIHATWLGKLSWFKRFPYDPENRRSEDTELLIRSYRKSTFACLPDFLYAYRRDNHSLKNNLIKRRYLCQGLIQQAYRQKNVLLLRGLFDQFYKAGIELIAFPLGLGPSLLRYSATKIPQGVANEWSEIWSECQKRQSETELAKAA